MVIEAAFEASSLPGLLPAGDAVHAVAVYHERKLHIIEHAVISRCASAFKKVKILRHRLIDHYISLFAEFSQGKTKSRA